MDISKCEGKILMYSQGDSSVECVVALADEGIGFSITGLDDPEDFYTCQIGPGSPKYHHSDDPEKDALLWGRKKEYLIEACEKGEFVVEDFQDYVYGGSVISGGNPSSSSCAFS